MAIKATPGMTERVQKIVQAVLERADIIDKFDKGCIIAHWGGDNVTLKLELTDRQK